MARPSKEICIVLTREEAYEILTRCLQSAENDTPTFQSAILRLARAIESTKEKAA